MPAARSLHRSPVLSTSLPNDFLASRPLRELPLLTSPAFLPAFLPAFAKQRLLFAGFLHLGACLRLAPQRDKTWREISDFPEASPLRTPSK